jgi:hypothetical protein
MALRSRLTAGGQISFAIAGVLVAAITFMVTAWFVIESKRQFALVGVLAVTALLPFVWLVGQPEEQFPGSVERLYLLNLTIWLLLTAYIAIVVFRSIMSAKRIRANEIYGAIYVSCSSAWSLPKFFNCCWQRIQVRFFSIPGGFPAP